MFIYTAHDLLGFVLLGLIAMCFAVLFVAHLLQKAKTAIKSKLTAWFGRGNKA